jgi:hypothetical protein
MMTLAVKICLLFSGLFLLAGMCIGILKYVFTMRSAEHSAPVYIDIAHRASLLYSFASLVMAKLIEFSPYSQNVQLIITGVPLIYFALTIVQYTKLGLLGQEQTQFSERNFITTWFMYSLVAGEIGGVSLILWGFIQTQLL